MRDEVLAEPIRVAAAAERQQRLAYQNAKSLPQDDPMTNINVVGGLPKSYNLGTPPTGSTGTSVPRATVGVHGLVLQSSFGKGRRSSPRTPGRSPRNDHVSGGRKKNQGRLNLDPTYLQS